MLTMLLLTMVSCPGMLAMVSSLAELMIDVPLWVLGTGGTIGLDLAVTTMRL